MKMIIIKPEKFKFVINQEINTFGRISVLITTDSETFFQFSNGCKNKIRVYELRMYATKFLNKSFPVCVH